MPDNYLVRNVLITKHKPLQSRGATAHAVSDSRVKITSGHRHRRLLGFYTLASAFGVSDVNRLYIAII